MEVLDRYDGREMHSFAIFDSSARALRPMLLTASTSLPDIPKLYDQCLSRQGICRSQAAAPGLLGACFPPAPTLSSSTAPPGQSHTARVAAFFFSRPSAQVFSGTGRDFCLTGWHKFARAPLPCFCLALAYTLFSLFNGSPTRLVGQAHLFCWGRPGVRGLRVCVLQPTTTLAGFQKNRFRSGSLCLQLEKIPRACRTSSTLVMAWKSR